MPIGSPDAKASAAACVVATEYHSTEWMKGEARKLIWTKEECPFILRKVFVSRSVDLGYRAINVSPKEHPAENHLWR